MKRIHVSSILGIFLLCSFFYSCENEEVVDLNTDASIHSKNVLNASIGIIGDVTNISTNTSGGTLLMGGSTDVDAAMLWMLQKSGGGDIVVLRSTGTDAYNQYLFDLYAVNSVETLLIDSKEKANSPLTEATIRNAEAVFIAGGDQYNYVSFWKDTKVENALNYLRNIKKVVIGGTSAGCAIQGGIYFDAENGTIRSEDALRNPYHRNLTLQKHNFIDNPYLKNVITDTHYDDPDRRGRHITFLARIHQDWGIRGKGIGVDERTAVCIDETGKARVFGEGYAFFLNQYFYGPERCLPRRSLDWYRDQRAVEVYKASGTSNGSHYFMLDRWTTGSGGSWQYYYIDRGRLRISY
ncbi:cyanophycinase [Aquimarina sp. SS2-1]|uniref:cyanophycinase n=1 Tax=Aquimarina besae TaxID=3342247 RepID=UPI00366B630A